MSDGMCHISFIHFRSKKNYFDLALIREKIMKLCAIFYYQMLKLTLTVMPNHFVF